MGSRGNVMKMQDKDSLGNYFMRLWLVSVGRPGLWNGHACWDRDSRRQQWEGRKKLLPSSTRKEIVTQRFQELRDCPTPHWSVGSS